MFARQLGGGPGVLLMAPSHYGDSEVQTLQTNHHLKAAKPKVNPVFSYYALQSSSGLASASLMGKGLDEIVFYL